MVALHTGLLIMSFKKKNLSGDHIATDVHSGNSECFKLGLQLRLDLHPQFGHHVSVSHCLILPFHFYVLFDGGITDTIYE